MTKAGYRVEIAPAAQRQLRRLPPGDAAGLRGPILALGLEPRPVGASKVTASDFWRIRVGEMRAIHAVDDDRRLVIILKVARRAESTNRRVR